MCISFVATVRRSILHKMSRTILCFIIGMCSVAAGSDELLLLPKSATYNHPGSSAEISCICRNPNITFYYSNSVSWYRNDAPGNTTYGTKLTSNGFKEDPYNRKYDVAFELIGKYGYSTTLIIKNITYADAGEYSCVLADESAMISEVKTMLVHVGDPTTVPTMVSTTSTSPTTVSKATSKITQKTTLAPVSKRLTTAMPKTTTVKSRTTTSVTKKVRPQSNPQKSSAGTAERNFVVFLAVTFNFLTLTLNYV